MNYLENPRLHLISSILEAKHVSSQLYVQSVSPKHQYGETEVLYMREAHFIMTVGPESGKIMSDVATALAVTHGAVSQIATRLEKKGYILRQKSDEDRRQTVVMLTEKGKAFYQQHLEYDSEKYAQLDQRFLSHFSDEELRLILEYEAVMAKIFAPKDAKANHE